MQLTDKERQLLRGVGQFISDKKAWVVSVGFYAFTAVNDWVSSLLGNRDPETFEMNPFARGPDLKFVLHKGMTVDAFFFVALCLSAFAVYHSIQGWNKLVARMAGCSLFVYVAYDRLMEAVIPNYLLDLHMYVKDTRGAEDLLRKLFGG